MAGGHSAKCGFPELIVFLFALVAGTACSLTSKILLDMKSVGMTGEEEVFSYPLFQTLGMFIGMTAALFVHALVLAFKIPFPGYKHKTSKSYSPVRTSEEDDDEVTTESVPLWMYFLLIIPAIFDLCATALCMYGLRHINVSIYQMLRGGAIVFVALLKQFVLMDKLKKFMWVGVFLNVVSIVLVGLTAVLSADQNSNNTFEGQDPVAGIVLVLAGALVQSLQYAFEEKVMSMDIAAPPLLLVGMEGLWGSIICITVLYPIAYIYPGDDHGSYENPFNTYAMIQNSKSIQFVFVLYFFSIFFYNMLACLVTFMLNSVWHAILDNFRPITVWGTSMFIYYQITQNFGEKWTSWSWLQLCGMFVLLYGTAVYNAPNAGSIKLTGGFQHLFLDFTEEYDEVEKERTPMVPIHAKETEPEMVASQYATLSPFLKPKRVPSMRGDPHKTSNNFADYGSSGNISMTQVTKKLSFA
jgi:drug/metabolite transporter (DMT)-like permease